MRLHTTDGAQKYLTSGERDAFLREAELADLCRLSEALALTADCVGLAAGVLVFESLKKRRAGIYHTVPAPPALLGTLDMVQKWLGHAQLTTTAIYANAVGAEEKDIASWPDPSGGGTRSFGGSLVEASYPYQNEY
jgi:integrase